MKILFISPLGFAVNQDSRYLGIEKLVYQFSAELIKEHQVTVMGRADSIYAQSVEVLPTTILSSEDTNYSGEAKQFREHQSFLRNFDVIHDFSHQHLASRFLPNLPSLNIFWHAPALAQYPKAPYNIIALSRWAAREFQRIYHQKAQYQQSICVDVDVYKPLGEPRNDRFLVVGRMGEEKGNLNAASICADLGVPLDIITARGAERADAPYSDYEKQVMALADGDKIKLWWEQDYTEASKIKMMQTNKALLYITDHPEVTSHKIQESLLCGQPVIVPNLGALPEIVTQGIDGFLCRTEKEYMDAIQGVDQLKPEKTYQQTKAIYSIENVVKGYLPLYKSVAEGLRW